MILFNILTYKKKKKKRLHGRVKTKRRKFFFLQQIEFLANIIKLDDVKLEKPIYY